MLFPLVIGELMGFFVMLLWKTDGVLFDSGAVIKVAPTGVARVKVASAFPI